MKPRTDPAVIRGAHRTLLGFVVVTAVSLVLATVVSTPAEFVAVFGVELGGVILVLWRGFPSD